MNQIKNTEKQNRSLVWERISVLILMLVISTAAKSEIDEGLVIIEKPEAVSYSTVESNQNYGPVTISRSSKTIGIASFNREFTNVELGNENIASSFFGLNYQYNYNFNLLSFSLEGIFALGKKSGKIDGEDSSSGLEKSLKTQILGELNLKIYLNFLESIWLRPYLGVGGYKLSYDYDGNSDNKTEKYSISSTVMKYGVSILLSSIDKASADNLWSDYGISRVSLDIESRKYTPISADNTAKFESGISLNFEY